MNITHVKWNKDEKIPTGDMGKLFLAEYNNGHFDVGQIHNIEWDNTKRYAILSDEQPEREPVIVEVLTASENDGIKECMVFADSFDYSEIRQSLIDIYGGRNVCLSSIEIGHIPENIKRYVDGLKPMKLMGIEPEIAEINHYWYINWNKDGNVYQVCRKDNREAVESWNSLVLKLTGETKWGR